MTCKGIVKGKTIELDEPLPYLEGRSVNITVDPVQEDDRPGSPAYALRMMHEPPHLEPGDIEEFERVLRESELPVESGGIFDEDRPE